MTPKIIELKQAPVVLVDLPVNFSEPTGISLGPFSDWSVQNLDTGEYYGLGQDLKTIGILSDLTEEQFAECVPKEMYSHITNPKAIWYEVYFYSLLESENVYTENPYGEDQRSYSELMDGVCRDKLAEDMRLWQEAQSRTIDPTRTVVLLRKEEKK